MELVCTVLITSARSSSVTAKPRPQYAQNDWRAERLCDWLTVLCSEPMCSGHRDSWFLRYFFQSGSSSNILCVALNKKSLSTSSVSSWINEDEEEWSDPHCDVCVNRGRLSTRKAPQRRWRHALSLAPRSATEYRSERETRRESMGRADRLE